MDKPFAVNIIGPRGGIQKTFKFALEPDAVDKQYALEREGKHVELVNLRFFPSRQKGK